ncbi:hypothetical protein ACOME3_005986 [Neoechinorhynchus agilis]
MSKRRRPSSMSTVAISPFLKTLLAVLLVYRENVLKTGQIPETDSIDRISKNGIVTPSRDFSVYLEKARNLFLAENSPVDEDKVIKLDNVDDYLCSLSILRMPSVGDDLNSGYCATDSDIVKIENPCRGRNVSKMSTNKEPQRKGEEWKSQEQTSTNGMSTFSTNIPTASMESRATETPGPSETSKTEQSEISLTVPEDSNATPSVSQGSETSTGAVAEESSSTIEPGSSTAETTESSLRSNAWMAQTIKMEQSEISTTEKTLEETTAETESNPFGDIELPDHLNVEKFVSEGLETSTGAVAEETSSTIEPGSSTAETTESSLRSNAWMAQTIKMEQSEISTTEKTLEETTAETESNPFGDIELPDHLNVEKFVSEGLETSTGAGAEESPSTIEPGSSTAETTESSLRSNVWMAQTIKMEQSEISTTEKTLEETTAETESNPFGDIELPDHLNVEKFVSEGLETSTGAGAEESSSTIEPGSSTAEITEGFPVEPSSKSEQSEISLTVPEDSNATPSVSQGSETSTGAVAEESSSTIEPGSSTAETTESSLRSNAWMAQTIKMEQSEISTTEKTLEETTAETESNPFGDIELPDHLNVEKFVSEGLETSTGAVAEESSSTIEPGSSTAEITESSLRSNAWMAQTIKMEQSEISSTVPEDSNATPSVGQGSETSTGAVAEESSSTIEPGSSTAEITEGFPVEPSSKSEQSEISSTVPEDSNATPSVSQGSETSTGAVAEESSSTIEPGSSTAETTESSLRSNAWMAQTIKMEQSEISTTEKTLEETTAETESNPFGDIELPDHLNVEKFVSEGLETSTGAGAEESSSTIEPGSSTAEITEGFPVEPSSKSEQSEISSTVPEDSNATPSVSQGSETSTGAVAEESSSTIEPGSSTAETTESSLRSNAWMAQTIKMEQSEISSTVPEDSNATPSVSQGSETSTGAVAEESSSTIEPGSSTAETTESSLRSNAWMAQTIKMEQSEISSTVTEDSNAQTLVSEGSETSTGAVAEETSSTIEPGSSTTEATEGSPVEPSSKTEQSEISSTVPEDSNTKTLVSEGSETGVSTGAEETSSTIERESSTTETTESARSADEQETGATLPSELSSTEQLELLSSAAQSTEISDAETLDVSSVNVEYDELSTSMPESTSPEFSEQNTESFFSTEGLASLTGMDSEEKGPYKNADDFDKKFNRQDPEPICSETLRGPHLSELKLVEDWRSQSPVYVNIAPDNSLLTRSAREYIMKRRIEGRNNSVIHIHARWDIESAGDNDHPEAVFASHASSIFVANLTSLKIIRSRKLLRVPFRSATYGLAINKNKSIIYVAVAPHHSIVLVDYKTLSQIRAIRIPIKHIIEDIVITNEDDLILSTKSGIYGVDKHDRFLGLLNVGVSIYEPHK